MALEVGSVFAKLGFKVDDSGADRFERRLRDVRGDARNDVEVPLKADYDSRGFDRYNRSVDDAHKKTTRFGASIGKTGTRFAAFAGGAAVAGGAAALYGLGKAASFVYDELAETQRVTAQVDAAIKSTGGAANVTTKEVLDLADSISKKSGMDDEAIANGQALLLTFKNVRNEVGEGNKIFNRATQSAADLSAKGFGSIDGASKMLGKALNDPIKGISALSRAGVTFTEGQKESIKAMVESGDTLGAQKTILKEVESQVGGSAEAYGKTLPGMVGRAKVALGNLAADLGQKIAPALTKAAEFVSKFFESLTSGGESTEGVRAVLGSIGESISMFVGLAGDALSRISDAFADTFGGNSGTVEDLETIGRFLLGFVDVVRQVYTAVARRILPGLETAFRGFFQVIRGVIRVIAGLLTGDFGKAWRGVKDIFAGGIRLTLGIFRAATAPFRELASKIGDAVTGVFGKAWDKIGDITETMEGVVRGAFNGIRNVVRFVIGKVIDGVDIFLGGLEAMARAASHLPFVGGKFKGVADAIAGARGKLQDLKGELDGTPGKASKIDPLLSKVRALKTAFEGAAQAADDAFEAAARATKKKPRKRAMGGRVGPESGGPGLFIAGEGAKDEWVISQEGPRTANIGWAVEALETLTGQRVNLYKRGKGSKGTTKGGKKRKRAGKATGAAGEAQRLVDYWETQLDHGERDYGQLERGFDMTDEDFLVEDGNGNLVLNQPGIKARQNELGKLYAARKKIKEIAQKYAKAVRAAIAAARTAIKRLNAAIKATKVVGESGPRGQAARDAAAKRRQGYRDQIADYESAIEDLGITRYEVGEAIQDYDLDLSGLAMEAAEVAGTTAPAIDTGGGGDTGGGDTGGDTETPESSAPSAADIAAAAAQQLDTFQAGRRDLFASFGSNVVSADRFGQAFATELGQAAGTAFFGATENSFGSGGGDTIVTQNITIAGTSTDELTFAQRAAGALKVAI